MQLCYSNTSATNTSIRGSVINNDKESANSFIIASNDVEYTNYGLSVGLLAEY